MQLIMCLQVCYRYWNNNDRSWHIGRKRLHNYCITYQIYCQFCIFNLLNLKQYILKAIWAYFRTARAYTASMHNDHCTLMFILHKFLPCAAYFMYYYICMTISTFSLRVPMQWRNFWSRASSWKIARRSCILNDARIVHLSIATDARLSLPFPQQPRFLPSIHSSLIKANIWQIILLYVKSCFRVWQFGKHQETFWPYDRLSLGQIVCQKSTNLIF